MTIEAELTKFVGTLAHIRRVAQQTAASAPADHQIQHGVGRAYSATGEHRKALDHFGQAAALQPANPAYLYDLGVAQQFAGDFDAARRSYQRAAQLAPGFYRALVSLALLDRQTPQDNLIAALERLVPGPDPDGMRVLHVGHALAKAYEDLGEPQKSFAWLLKAKDGRKRVSPYSFEREQRLFQAAAATWPLGHRPRPGHPSGEPVFVVGLPRTGTTLVDRILSSHPQVASAGELSHFPQATARMTTPGAPQSIDLNVFERARDVDLARLGRAYVDSTRPLTGATPRFVDKAPINYLYAGLIAQALPEARIVCLRREPMDSVLSNFRQMFATPQPYYNWVYDLADTARNYVLFDRLCRHWREVLPADRYVEIAYEALVDDQEVQTRGLLEFCGLPWDERCLAFHENTAAVATPSSVQVRSPVYRSSIGRWRRYGALLDPAKKVLADAGIAIE